MAIANDMIIAVSSEENTEGTTEFYVHNVVCLFDMAFQFLLEPCV